MEKSRDANWWANLIIDNGEAGSQLMLGSEYDQAARDSFLLNAETQIHNILEEIMKIESEREWLRAELKRLEAREKYLDNVNEGLNKDNATLFQFKARAEKADMIMCEWLKGANEKQEQLLLWIRQVEERAEKAERQRDELIDVIKYAVAELEYDISNGAVVLVKLTDVIAIGATHA